MNYSYKDSYDKKVIHMRNSYKGTIFHKKDMSYLYEKMSYTEIRYSYAMKWFDNIYIYTGMSYAYKDLFLSYN